jgi:lysozyme
MDQNSSLFLECLAQIKNDEGFRSHAYVCPAGALTIGYGRNVDQDKGGAGISEAEGRILLVDDISDCAGDLRVLFPRWEDFGTRRQATLLNLRYQLGPHRFRGFANMIDAINHNDWTGAARELRSSALYKQTTARTERRAKELQSGT